MTFLTVSNCSILHYSFYMGTLNIEHNRHCGLDTQSPERERLSSRIGDGVPLPQNDGFFAMTVKVLG